MTNGLPTPFTRVYVGHLLFNDMHYITSHLGQPECIIWVPICNGNNIDTPHNEKQLSIVVEVVYRNGVTPIESYYFQLALWQEILWRQPMNWAEPKSAVCRTFFPHFQPRILRIDTITIIHRHTHTHTHANTFYSVSMGCGFCLPNFVRKETCMH